MIKMDKTRKVLGKDKNALAVRNAICSYQIEQGRANSAAMLYVHIKALKKANVSIKLAYTYLIFNIFLVLFALITSGKVEAIYTLALVIFAVVGTLVSMRVVKLNWKKQFSAKIGISNAIDFMNLYEYDMTVRAITQVEGSSWCNFSKEKPHFEEIDGLK